MTNVSLLTRYSIRKQEGRHFPPKYTMCTPPNENYLDIFLGLWKRLKSGQNTSDVFEY